VDRFTNANGGKWLGRFAVIDGFARRTDSALKTHVASFHGNHFVAERDGQNLHVHMLHDETGRPALENPLHHEEGGSGIRSSAGGRLDTAGVGGIGSITELNELNRKAYVGIGIVRRRA
jgi:hypothetical protein